jgi:D-glycero-D-manno-heptose 1,7-bisphosphate phosphatase
MPAQPTVFLDRDGTILKEVSYLSDASRTELLPGVAQALATLQKYGIQLIVVSNQSGIARGLLDEGDLVAIQNKIDKLLQPYGVRIDGYYHCPHHPEVGVAPERRTLTLIGGAVWGLATMYATCKRLLLRTCLPYLLVLEKGAQCARS